jgi:hypothetical protein
MVDLAPVIDRRRHGSTTRCVPRRRYGSAWRCATATGPGRCTVVDGPDGWLARRRLTAGLEDLDPFPVGDPLLGAQGALYLEDAERQVWWYPPAELTPALRAPRRRQLSGRAVR